MVFAVDEGVLITSLHNGLLLRRPESTTPHSFVDLRRVYDSVNREGVREEVSSPYQANTHSQCCTSVN